MVFLEIILTIVFCGVLVGVFLMGFEAFSWFVLAPFEDWLEEIYCKTHGEEMEEE